MVDWGSLGFMVCDSMGVGLVVRGFDGWEVVWVGFWEIVS